MYYDVSNGRIVSNVPLQVPAGTLYVSENLSIGGSNLAFFVRDVAGNRTGFLTAYSYDSTGSTSPHFREL